MEEIGLEGIQNHQVIAKARETHVRPIDAVRTEGREIKFSYLENFPLINPLLLI